MSTPPSIPPRPSRAMASSPPDSAAPPMPSIPPRPNRNRSKSPMPQSAEAEASKPSPSGVRFEEPLQDQVETLKLSGSPEDPRTLPSDLDLHQPIPTTRRARDRTSRGAMEAEREREENRLPPEIGQRVPMYPFAGDVQAPSPVPGRARSQSRHRQKKSAHGHQLHGNNQEEGPVIGDFGAYPTGLHAYRQGGTYSLSSEDLNLSVMQAVHGAGVATTPGLEAVPDEEIGYMATEEYTSRQGTPLSTHSGLSVKNRDHRLSTEHITSPLAREALGLENDPALQLQEPKTESPPKNEIYGMKSPSFNISSTSLHAGSGTNTPGWSERHMTEFQDERHQGTPILASDELNKSTHFLPPAVSPRVSATQSRRPSSISEQEGLHINDDVDEEALSDPPSPIKEHEPLFPDSPKGSVRNHLTRPKLSDNARHSNRRFPSKDIWEDAPESTQVTYEVKTPELAAQDDEADVDAGELDISKTTGSEKEVETAKADQVELEKAKQTLSQDDVESAPKASTAAPPPIPAQRPLSRQPPVIPARPVKDSSASTSPTELKRVPSIPDRPKPVIPNRPSRVTSAVTSPDATSSDSAVTSPTASDKPAPPPVKAKPPVPAKIGGNISALRANFMSDLNSKLGKGPVVPKKEDPVEEPKEVEPLEDVRKSRARGPARRKPQPTEETAKSSFAFAPITTLWHIDESGSLNCHETLPPVDNAVPIETALAATTQLPAAETDTAKQVLDISPAPAPESVPASATSDLPSDLQLSASVKDKSDIPIQPASTTDGGEESSMATMRSPTSTTSTTEKSIQTGEMKIETNMGDDDEAPGETKTVYLGGNAQTGANVVE